MVIHIPDPHPGRCLNVRHGWANHAPYALRCLDYEGTEHVCTFPDPPPEFASSWSTMNVTNAQPQPWVRPRDKAPE